MSKSFVNKALLGGAVAAGAAVWAIAPRSFSDKRHSYELPEQDGWAQMEQFCKTMSHQDDIWYATNIEIVNALENASRLQFTVNGDLCYNPNAASCWVSVGGKNYELPGGTTTRLE